MRVLWLALLVFVSVGFATCGFSPHPKNGALPCDKGCPSGYLCGTDNRCWQVDGVVLDGATSVPRSDAGSRDVRGGGGAIGDGSSALGAGGSGYVNSQATGGAGGTTPKLDASIFDAPVKPGILLDGATSVPGSDAGSGGVRGDGAIIETGGSPMGTGGTSGSGSVNSQATGGAGGTTPKLDAGTLDAPVKLDSTGPADVAILDVPVKLDSTGRVDVAMLDVPVKLDSTAGVDIGGPTCSTGWSYCSTGCVNLATDPENCGGCGSRCPSGQYCSCCVARYGSNYPQYCGPSYGCWQGTTDCTTIVLCPDGLLYSCPAGYYVHCATNTCQRPADAGTTIDSGYSSGTTIDSA